jgi:S-ribosylhomocysteine lyase LuxS involved in autoinducer biosynthesis
MLSLHSSRRLSTQKKEQVPDSKLEAVEKEEETPRKNNQDAGAAEDHSLGDAKRKEDAPKEKSEEVNAAQGKKKEKDPMESEKHQVPRRRSY